MKVKYISAIVMAFLLLAAVTGCGDKTARLYVTGTVTMNDRPIAKGQITFTPRAGSNGPTAGAPVIDGRYEILAERGPMAGTFRVEITALRPTGQRMQSTNVATGQMETTSGYESMIPPRYNLDSELTAEITADGSNEFDFNLTSP